MMNRARGIALIDLLVLVALIPIIAAIFIPQFAAFAVRTQNAAAISDLRGAVAAEESLFADYGGYGRSDLSAFGTGLPGSGGTGAAVELSGPLSPATATTDGALLTMGAASGPPFLPPVGIGISVSADVTLRADTTSYSGSRAGYGASYILTAKHRMGDTAFAAEAENKKSIHVCRNSSAMWVGIPGLSMVMLPSVTTGPDLNATACGGMEIPVWTPLQ